MKKKPARKRPAPKKPSAKKAPAKKTTRKKAPARKRSPKASAAKSAQQPEPPAASEAPAAVFPAEPPAWLGEKPAQQWPIVVEQLRQRDRLDHVTPQHVAIYCQTLSKYQAAMDRVDVEGFTVVTEQGEFVTASAQFALKMIDRVRQLSRDLGLNDPVVSLSDPLAELRASLAQAQK